MDEVILNTNDQVQLSMTKKLERAV